jgi:hypothetical protein
MMRKMTNGLLAVGLLFVGFASANAQDVSDDDIKNYAIIELAKNSIVEGISPMVNEMIEKQEGMTGQRFQELQNSSGAAAEDWEKQFMALVNKQIEKKKTAATDVVKLLAANAMGSATYNATKAAVASDATAKAKFESYLSALQ